MTYISLDYETHDPTLKDKGKVKARGTSCVFGLGRVIVAGFYDGTRKWSIDGEGGEYVRSLLLSPDVTIIGANIQYDAVWAVTSLKLDPKDVRCRYIDVSVAESLIDEYQKYDLDSLAWKYLKERKGKSVLEDICAAKGLKGDFRGHLAELWDDGYRQEIRDYVMSDADQPWRIWEQQKRIIESEGLMKAFQMNMDMLRVTVFMKVRGVRFDLDRWRANCRTAGDAYARLRDEYEGKYGQVNINSSKQLAVQMDRFDVPYKCKLTFKGWKPEGRKFTKEDLFEGDELTRQKKTLREIFNGVTLEKGKIVLYVPKRYASRTWEQAAAMGYEVLCNPCVNKAMFTELSETHPIVADLAQYKQAKNIVDKFLGPAFGRFIVAHYADGTAGPAFGDDGTFLGEGAAEYRIHSTYNVVGARQTGRMSSSQCNNQQIPSKTVLFAKTDHELDLARLCRECFIAAPRHALVKQDYCLSLDSLFLTTEGYMRGDRLMEKARQLVSLDRKAQGYRAYVQERDMIAFELSNGVILKQIPEHRHYATDRKESYVKLAKDFKVGDQLAFYKDFLDPDSHEDDAAGLLGYACGLYLGDGYIRDGGSSGEIILHKDNLDFVKEQQGVFTGSLRHVGDIWHAGMRAEFCRWLLDQGFGRKDGKTIPDWVLSSPAVFRAGLIAGLLDTDAFVEKGRCVITMCREPLMRRIAELLACVGIYTVWTEQHVPAEKNNFGREHTNYNLYIRYMPPEMFRKIFYFMRVRTCAMACWHNTTTMKNLSWRFDYDSLPDDMFVQRRGAEYKSLYMARYFGRGIPAGTAAALGFWQKDKFPVTIRKIYPVRGEALIMECDTHSFVTANMPTMNCAQENRLAAYFAPGPNGERIRQMYRDDPFLDEHSYVTEVSGLAEQYGAKAGRKFAKNLRFGVSYGMQVARMMIQFGWDKEFAEDLYDKVASAAPWLFELMDKVQETVLRRRYITTLAGRRVHMRRGHDKDAYKYMNYLIQGSAADMTKTATNAVYDGMLAEYDRAGSSPDEVVLSVHDEDDFDVDCTDVENAVSRIMEIRRSMEDTSGCDLPIISCPEIGTSWADGIEWDPSLGDCEDFVRRACTAIRDGRFGELREQAKAWQHREEDDGMSFSEFCSQVDEDEDDDEAVVF